MSTSVRRSNIARWVLRARGAALLAGSFCSLSAAVARAEVEPTSALERPIEIHGFVSQGLILTTQNNYLAQSERGSVEFSEVGINFTKSLSDELRAGMQLFAYDLGPTGNYQPKFDWFYLDYRFRDWLGLRAGRLKIPFGLYNETNDVDAARVPVLLPQSVYPIENRNFLLAQTGAELYGNLNLGEAGGLEYRVYGGTIFIDSVAPPNAPIWISDLSVPYVVGARVMWTTPLDGLQIGGTAQALHLDIEYSLDAETSNLLIAAGLLPPDFGRRVEVEFPVRLWVASIEYAAHDLTLSGEYGRWSADLESSHQAVVQNVHAVNERFYAMASYRIRSWFTPGLYYSVFYPSIHDREGRDAYQHDAALTLRYDLSANWLLKLEGHFMHGTAALESALNDDKPKDLLTRDWALLLIKTTAYF